MNNQFKGYFEPTSLEESVPVSLLALVATSWMVLPLSTYYSQGLQRHSKVMHLMTLFQMSLHSFSM